MSTRDAPNAPEPRRHLRSTPTSAILRSLAAAEKEAVPVRDIVSAFGARAHGLAMVLFSLPDALPLPVPSLSAVLGVPLVIIAAHLVIFGEGSGLPERILAARIPRSALALLARYGAPALEMLELITRPRWHRVLASERLIGVVCLYLALLLLMPIPLVNFPPAVCLVVIALGMVQRDGLLVAAGLVLAGAMTYSLQFVAGWIAQLFGGA